MSAVTVGVVPAGATIRSAGRPRSASQTRSAAQARSAARGASATHGGVRLRLTRRGRVVLTTLAALPLVIAAFAFALNGGGATATDHAGSTTFEHVTVQSGQTLWQLAGEIAPSADPRDVITAIVQLNNLGSGDVQAGEQLAIPAEYTN
ncbi:MAG TPA: LysM peptidoglycan-binding domain-containing protein [Lacisediminihabitans sp.]|uniref:LysM peptidoglycan-binding domain-containing protein n=1 Tax=Lacisediminihabitans sp. TaxID=2787631 RepID=UPI002EDAADDF